MEKKCKKCLELKDVFLFNKNKQNKDGLYTYCIICERILKRIYYLNNKKKILNKAKNYYSLNNNDRLFYAKQYQKNNPDKINKYQRLYRVKKPKVCKKISEKYYQNNKEKISQKFILSSQKTDDRYIKIQLNKNGFKKEQITPELIEVKRLIIKTIRLCKTLQN